MPRNADVIARFHDLIRDVLEQTPTRNSFDRWEIELLLDLTACDLPPARMREALKRYQRVAHLQLSKGAESPPLFSDFLSQEAEKQSTVA